MFTKTQGSQELSSLCNLAVHVLGLLRVPDSAEPPCSQGTGNLLHRAEERAGQCGATMLTGDGQPTAQGG